MEGSHKSSDSKGPSRPYRSPHRQEQAQRTRQQILASARTEFLTSGYAGTTMAAVAARAEVSAATVEKGFGTKPRLLKEVIDVAIVGDDDPVPVLARTSAAAADAVATIQDFMGLVADTLTAGQQRSARLVIVAMEAAATDPTLRSLSQQRLDQRRSIAEWIVDGILSRAQLRQDLDRTHAIDIVWLLMEPALFCRLTEDRQWSSEQYHEWFANSTTRLLIDDAWLTETPS